MNRLSNSWIRDENPFKHVCLLKQEIVSKHEFSSDSSRLVGVNLAGTSESSTSNFASTSAQGIGGSGAPFGGVRGGSGCPVLPGGSSGTHGGFGGLGTSEENSQPMLPSSAAEDGYLGISYIPFPVVLIDHLFMENLLIFYLLYCVKNIKEGN